MRAEQWGKWTALLAAAWLATGCATLAPRTSRPSLWHDGTGGALQGAASASEAGEEGRPRRRPPVRMPSGTAVDLGDMAVLAVATGMVEVDAFEKLLVYAGLDPTGELPPRGNPFTPDEAARVLALLLQKPVTRGHFPPRLAAAHLLREVLESGKTSRQELLRRVERFQGVAVLRPDGYLAWVLNGRTQQRVGPVQWKEGALRAGPFELGRFYNGQRWVFRPVDSRLRPVDGPGLAEVYDDADAVSRTLDGAEEAFVELYHALGQLITRPLDSLAALQRLPAAVAALIASSPEYWERFRYMTAGEQMKAVSKLVTTLYSTWGAAAGTTRTLGGALAGAEARVPVLSLSAEGALVMERIAVPVGQAASVLGGGPGAALILHRANTSANGSSPAGGPGQWGPARESMKPPARRYQEQITGHSADDAYWVGGVSREAGGVKFDGFKDGVLLEAKGPGYAKFFDGLEPEEWFRHSGAEDLIAQARRQSRRVQDMGIPIEWHVAEAKAAEAIKDLLDGAGLKSIRVIHTPAR